MGKKGNCIEWERETNFSVGLFYSVFYGFVGDQLMAVAHSLYALLEHS
jgi:hypothetical protein